MHIQTCEIPGVLLIEPKVFVDPRGCFLECFQDARYRDAGIDGPFVQDNYSHSVRGTLRGMHYQIEHPQAKLVWVMRGEVFDAVIDLRRGSPTFGRSWGTILNDSNRRQLYLPAGLAHGFCVTSDSADVIYKCTDLYYPQHERTIIWNDPELAIPWPVAEPLLSPKDVQGVALADAACFDSDLASGGMDVGPGTF